jgi:hypothetical protein
VVVQHVPADVRLMDGPVIHPVSCRCRPCPFEF